jgi:hypothetical protein
LQPIGRQLDFIEPNARRFLVVEIDGGREFFGRQAEPFLIGQKLPGPMDRLALEIVAETEIAEHLEERVVIGGAAHVVDVAGAEAFLAGRGPGEVEFASAEKMVFELIHAGGRKEHRGVPSRHQHVAGPACAALGLEEGQIFFAEFVGFHNSRVVKRAGLSAVGIDVESHIISASRGDEKRGAGVATPPTIGDNRMVRVRKEKGGNTHGYHGFRSRRGTANPGWTKRL